MSLLAARRFVTLLATAVLTTVPVTAVVLASRTLTTANAALPPSTPPVCISGIPVKPSLYFRVRGSGAGRIRFTGKLTSPCPGPLGTANMRPLVLVEVRNGRHWQPLITARCAPSGAFRVTYHGGRGGSVGGTFTFRVRAPSTPRFLAATSRTRRARVR